MIRLKNKKDIAEIKEAIEIGEWCLRAIRKQVKPGVTTLELNAMIEKWIIKAGATPSFKGYNGFPYASCISVNEGIVHGLPSDRKIQKEDVVKVDIGVCYKGYYSDQADTIGLDPCSERISIQCCATEIALDNAFRQAKVGNTLNDIAMAIEQTALKYRFGILRDYTGHGVGFDVHEAPRIFNRPCLANDIELEKGMVLAIEPMFTSNLDGKYTKRKDGSVVVDGIGTHFERTIIIQ